MDVWATIADERHSLADLFATLDEAQLRKRSLCGTWTMHDMAAHLVMPHTVTMPKFALAMVMSRGSFERANVAMTSKHASRPIADLVADLHRYAESHFRPPGLPVTSQLAEILIHGQDIRVPLGIDDTRDAEHWAEALDFLVSVLATRGFVAGRLPRVRWLATDHAWSHDSSDGDADAPEVRGPASALGLAMAGREVAVASLKGTGAPVVAGWLERRR